MAAVGSTIPHPLKLLLLMVVVVTCMAGEYCDDFESDDFGTFWTQGALDSGGKWQPASYQELQQTIADFPAPASGDTVVYLTPLAGGYMSARLQMTAGYLFPEGSTLSFRYWLRSQWRGSGTLEVHRVLGSQEEAEPILSLTEFSGPDNTQWMEANVTVPTSSSTFKLLIFGACGTGELNNIAIDDIKVCGPAGLDQKCIPLTTTSTEASTTTATTEPSSVQTTAQSESTPSGGPTAATTAGSPGTDPTASDRPTSPEGPTSAEPVTTPTSGPTVSTSRSPTGRPPTAAPPTAPAPADGSRLGPSGLLWAVLAVLAASVALLLLLALGRRRNSARSDRLPLVRQPSSSGSGSSGSGSSGWFDYLHSDPWRQAHDKMAQLRY
ncbi:large proline-rich protein BAG6-like [Amphibalanus amphitrite]|uniref:large proline-rich protein BAG6-like n=1 Tax=Amphibalanus amphitrite TaxID=1232801 RepID=UPI001C923423|nr:large proline-rich protein BAG6-like [Amphibalanus amphitrite]